MNPSPNVPRNSGPGRHARHWVSLACALGLPLAPILGSLPASAQFAAAAARLDIQAIDLAGHGHRAEADALFRRALQLDLGSLGPEHPATAVAYSDFAANLAAEGKIAEAEQLSARAVAILRARRATALQGADGPEAALTLAKAELNHADPLRFVFDSYLRIAWMLAGERHADAEALRSRAFVAAQELAGSASAQAMAMAAARSATQAGPLAALLREQQALTARVVALDQRLLAAGESEVTVAPRAELHRDMLHLAAINRQIDQAFPAYRAIISPQPLDLRQARAALAPGEGLLFVVASGNDIHSFAVGPEGSAWNRAEGAIPRVTAGMQRLHCQVDPHTCRTREAVAPTPFAAQGYRRYDLATAHALFATLVGPVEAALAKVHTLYVVTSGMVGDLPLAMLVTAPPAAGIDDADPRVLLAASWLAERYAFIHLPAVAGLRLRTTRVRAIAGDATLDGYGDPILEGTAEGATIGRSIVLQSGIAGGPMLADPLVLRALPPLPGTRRELTSMAASMGESSASLHLQSQATERAVKSDPLLSRATIVVFATHGILPGEIEGHQEPGLILTPPETASVEDDGILTASEASQLSIHADWVVLSACNTASSQGAAGPDSLSSLARGFLYAGARALLASHWRVSDDATAALTVETLAARRRRPDHSGARALQDAMRAVRTGHRQDGSAIEGWQDDWVHPAAWAAFSYIADHDD